MGKLTPFHWLIVLAIIVLLFGGKAMPEAIRSLVWATARAIRAVFVTLFGPRGVPKIVNRLVEDMDDEFRNGPGGGPQHPIPVTGPVETKTAAKDSPEQKRRPDQKRKAA